MRTQLTFKEVYELPLRNDEWGCYAWANNDTMSLMFDFGVSNEDRKKVVDAINGEAEHKIPNLRKDVTDFFDGDTYIFCVRGWGNLTGIGALNLPSAKAEKIQDEFAEHVFKSLT